MTGAFALTAWTPHLTAVTLIAARLVPVAFLCPVMGGPAVPAFVRLWTVGALSLSLHFAGNVRVPVGIHGPFQLCAHVVQEVLLGTTLGLTAGLAFDAARMGGRFIDSFRGTSAEAALPLVGTREAASGDLLYQLLVAGACAGVALPRIVTALWRSFGVVRLGVFVPSQDVVLTIATLACAAVATGLAIGAPVAAACLAVDGVLSLAARVVPQLPIQEHAPALKILGGGLMLWVGVDLLSRRLLEEVLGVEGAIQGLLEVAR